MQGLNAHNLLATFSLAFFRLTLVCLVISVAFGSCSTSKPIPHKHGCFRPVPRNHLVEIRNPKEFIAWPSAHRGGQEFGPDNSIATIKAASRWGVPLLEVDVRRLKSGELILFHDKRLSTDNYTGPQSLLGEYVSNLSRAQVNQLRIKGSNEVPPELQTALLAVRGTSSLLQLDIKGDWQSVGLSALSLAKTLNLETQILIQCYSIECLAGLKAIEPKVAVLMRISTEAELSQAIAFGAEVIQLDSQTLTPALVEKIHAAGKRILIKSLGAEVDNASNWQKLLTLGVDIVMTDRPVAFFRATGKSGRCG